MKIKTGFGCPSPLLVCVGQTQNTPVIAQTNTLWNDSPCFPSPSGPNTSKHVRQVMPFSGHSAEKASHGLRTFQESWKVRFRFNSYVLACRTVFSRDNLVFLGAGSLQNPYFHMLFECQGSMICAIVLGNSTPRDMNTAFWLVSLRCWPLR